MENKLITIPPAQGLMFGNKKKFVPGKPFQVKKADINLLNLYVPYYQLSQLRVPSAIIINGKQLIIKKLPNKKDFFIDKDLGMFEIKPENAFFLNKTAVYFYDTRNQNPIHPGLLDELWKWANANGLYKIRRVDLEHGKKLRSLDSANLSEQMEAQKKETRKFMSDVLQKIKDKNIKTQEQQRQETGTVEENDEYKKINPEDSNYLIVENMFNHGYIDSKQAENLNHKLTLKQITSTDDLLHELESFSDVYVTKPISHELERILDDFHTYKPRDIIGYIKELSKIRNGMKNLRTKPVINWFPSMYILFGALGIGIILILYNQYGGDIDLSSIVPGT